MEIRLKNLTKEFPGNPKKNIPDTVAVDNLSVTIPDGELVGLLGPSGCGKSTTLYMIAGLKNPTSGEIWFGDQDVTNLTPEKRGIGLVFQNYALYPHMTVYKNVAFPLPNIRVEKPRYYRSGEPVLDENGNQVYAPRKLNKAEIDALVRQTSKLVQIDEYLDRKPSQLSGGQQQRVAIARALVKKPKVLLLDEPLSNLDARLRIQTREEIRRIQKETGITTVFVTHDQEEAMSICDKIVVMKLGVQQQIGAPQEVYNDPHNLFVATFLGTPPINVFKGHIEQDGIYIGSDKVLENTKGYEPKAVFIGIRPEGFLFGAGHDTLGMHVENVTIMGRDILLNASHKDCTKPIIKVELSSDIKLEQGDVRCGVRPDKIFVFDGKTEERLYL